MPTCHYRRPGDHGHGAATSLATATSPLQSQSVLFATSVASRLSLVFRPGQDITTLPTPTLLLAELALMIWMLVFFNVYKRIRNHTKLPLYHFT